MSSVFPVDRAWWSLIGYWLMSAHHSSPAPVLAYDRARRSGRLLRLFMLWAWICPLVPLVVLHGLWIAEWIALSRQPDFGSNALTRMVGDAPRNFTGFVLLTSPTLMFLSLPTAILLIPAWIRQRDDSASSTRLRALLFLHYSVCILFLMWDPFRALYWFMD